jgi:HSP20 family protein
MEERDMARTLARWDPFTELASMRNVFDRMFDESLPRFAARLNGDELAGYNLGIDVYETPEELVVKAAVPGVDPNDVEISVEEDVLTIKGETRQENEANDETFIRRELRYGAFQRTLRLPPTVEAEKASAEFENGVLKLHLPKKPEARARSIKITPHGVIEGGATAEPTEPAQA